MEFLQTLAVLAGSTAAPLLIYGFTKCGLDFDLLNFLWYGRTRITLTALLVLILAGAVTYDPELTKTICSFIGYDVGQSTAGIGAALGGTLVALIRGNKHDEDDKTEIPDTVLGDIHPSGDSVQVRKSQPDRPTEPHI